MSVPVQIRILREGATPPAVHSTHAAGLDIAAAPEGGTDIILPPGEIRKIPCGFAMAIPPGYEAQVRPRSGLALKHGITLINSPGTIDADYRGEVLVPLINHGSEPFTVSTGMRIAQMIIAPIPPVTIEVVDALDSTERGGGGFGSTGV